MSDFKFFHELSMRDNKKHRTGSEEDIQTIETEKRNSFDKNNYKPPLETKCKSFIGLKKDDTVTSKENKITILMNKNSVLTRILKNNNYDINLLNQKKKIILKNEDFVNILYDIHETFEEKDRKIEYFNNLVEETRKDNSNYRNMILSHEETYKKENDLMKRTIADLTEKLAKSNFHETSETIQNDKNLNFKEDDLKFHKLENKIKELIIEKEGRSLEYEELKKNLEELEYNHHTLQEKIKQMRLKDELNINKDIEFQELKNENKYLDNIFKDKIENQGKSNDAQLNDSSNDNLNAGYQMEILNLHLGNIIDGLYATNNTNDHTVSNKENQPNLNLKYYEIFINAIEELLVEKTLIEHINKTSLNFLLISSYVNENFESILHTSFDRNEGDHFYTIYNQFLEDLHYRIFENTMKMKQSKSKEMMWEVNSEDVTSQIIEKTIEDYYMQNITNSLSKQEDVLNILNENLERTTKLLDLPSNGVFKIENLVDKINKKLAAVQSQYKNIISELINKCCSKTLSNGNIITGERNNERVLFSFKNYYNEYLNYDRNPSISTFSINNALSNLTSVDCILNGIRFSDNQLKQFYISANLNGKIDFNLKSVLKTLVIFTPNLATFSLNEAASLTKDQLTSLQNYLIISKIQHLDVSNSKLGNDNVKTLLDSLKKSHKTVKKINLVNNELTTNFCPMLSDFLKDYLNLEYLFLGSNNLSGKGMIELSKGISIQKESNLKFIDLSDNKLTYDDISIISNHLINKNEFLEGINLSKNNFDSESVHIFGVSLRNNIALKKIYLNSVNLNQDSSPYFFHHLSESKIEEIYLDDNNLGEIGGILFANVIKNNNNLKEISMKKCRLNSLAIHCICKGLEINRTLLKMHLDENTFDDQSVVNLKNSSTKNNLKITLTRNYISDRSVDLVKNCENFIIF